MNNYLKEIQKITTINLQYTDTIKMIITIIIEMIIQKMISNILNLNINMYIIIIK